jgi:hypothetical protein
MTRRRRNLSHDFLKSLLGDLLAPAVLLSCSKSFNKLTVVNDQTMLSAFSEMWTARPDRRTPQLALCHVGGIIQKVYDNLVWTKSSSVAANGYPMFSFTGKDAVAYQHLIGTSVAAVVKRQGCANPVYYLNC